MIREFAPAKLNLYLHITGRRVDGYHNLDSLVAFAGVGDHIRLGLEDSFEFAIEGPQSAGLQNEPPHHNLVVKAVRSLAERVGREPNVKLTLLKNLPVASGIGGGSSDAAAGLRALAQHWELLLDDPRLLAAAAEHGQDVPVCLKIVNNYITESGTAPAPDLPHADLVLVNPNKPLPTADVYKAFKQNMCRFSPEAQLTAPPVDLPALITALRERTNDLYEPACSLMPDIRRIVEALEKTSNCLLARMSGSGATCFGMYPDRASARQAAATILEANPGWWVTPSYLPYRGSAVAESLGK
ncbi:MAG: 4-(cytidine 5'-diphospho)-2-C-methyl-D-erythritol kinase [Alphaproteobacteria bacterium]|nr:4-(cytidine 5'-diphospho)-2-C-methyl-D-erythritol kinase [Alphaproteobacteria bacterium]